MKKLEYVVNEELGTVGDKKLRIIEWYGNPAKIDLRSWWHDEESGAEKCSKGLTFTDEEATELVSLLSGYLKKKAKATG